jgi:predicted amidophosphoribosyltransferase
MVLQTTSINYFSSSFPHYYLYDYLPLSAGKDMISRSLLKFKHRTQPDFNTWIDCALEALHGIPPTPDTIILRALHHDEMIAGTKFPVALDFLGHALAGQFSCRYLPSFLRKSRSVRPCKELSRRQRKTELRGIYSLDPAARQVIAAPALFPTVPHVANPSALPSANPLISDPRHAAPSAIPPAPSGAKAFGDGAPDPPFLLIDDILTTGTTMRMIIQPLHRAFPLSPIRIFTLARANDDPQPATDNPPPIAGNPPHEF